MKRNITLEKKAKEVIIQQIEELGKITTESVMELIRPHFIFNAIDAKERELRRKANNIMRQFRDERGIRTCFNYSDRERHSVYINIDETIDIEALDGVEVQINRKFYGLNEVKNKIQHRKQVLSGQASIFDSK